MNDQNEKDVITQLCEHAKAIAYEEYAALRKQYGLTLLGRPLVVAIVLQGLVTRIADSSDTAVAKLTGADAGKVARVLCLLMRSAAEDVVPSFEVDVVPNLPRVLEEYRRQKGGKR